MTGSGRPVTILMLEDSPLDAELTLSRLNRAGIEHAVTRVDSREAFLAALEQCTPDLILADFVLPGFDGLSALALARERCPDIPFIFVSGALGEERAIDSLLHGATDYVLKQRPERLLPAVRRALAESAARHERRQAELVVRESEQRLRVAMAAGRMSAWSLDLESGRLTWSDETSEVFGGPDGALPGDLEGLIALLAPEEGERLRGTVARALEKRSDHSAEFRWPRPDGSEATVNLSGRVLAGPDGEPIRIVGVATDVTQQRRSDEHLRRVQRMEALGRLAGGMAHEANNQMAVVIGFADFILRRPDIPEDVRGDLEQIRRAAKRTASVTQQLLTFSRRQLVQPEILELNAVVEGFGPVLRRTLGDESRLECRLGEPRYVRIGQGQIEQILLNLALNAADAMPGGGVLTIEAMDVTLPSASRGPRQGFEVREGHYVLLAVSDTGTGMDQETVDRIFEPFFTTKEVGKGSGLGLAAVYGIVKQADGYVWADSQPGHGSTIQVYLPLVPPPEPATAQTGSAVTGGSEQVLLVEDEPQMRAIAARALQAEGYQVQEAGNGREALELIHRDPGAIQLVVSDVAMPVVDGRSLRAQLAQQRPGLPVLLISGYTHEDLVRRGILADGEFFLQKPFAPVDLAKKVREVLDRR
jgi:two-component system, cell cycle sensor histidine kinase and response regulator CckA